MRAYRSKFGIEVVLKENFKSQIDLSETNKRFKQISNYSKHK